MLIVCAVALASIRCFMFFCFYFKFFSSIMLDSKLHTFSLNLLYLLWLLHVIFCAPLWRLTVKK